MQTDCGWNVVHSIGHIINLKCCFLCDPEQTLHPAEPIVSFLILCIVNSKHTQQEQEVVSVLSQTCTNL